MDIKVKKTSRYHNVTVIDGNATIETGLLDDEEAEKLARNFLEAARDLLGQDKLTEIFNE